MQLAARNRGVAMPTRHFAGAVTSFCVFVSFALVCFTFVARAEALEQAKHRSISRDRCHAAGLPWGFCERVGTAAYNTDRYEWNDLAAHAQIAAGQPACAAANAARARVRRLGADIASAVDALAVTSSPDEAERIADLLGRALHTVQDNCAHRGMPNRQHAWFSLSDTCKGTRLSPDLAPAAIACARAETDAVMADFVIELEAGGALPEQLDQVDEGWAHWPLRDDVCAFLASAREWNGTDGTWSSDVMVPALREQLSYAMTIEDASLGDVCAAAGASTLAPVWHAGTLDTSRGLGSCFKVRTYCLGKADAADEAPPWADEAEDEAEAEAPPARAVVGGCAVGGGRGATGSAAWMIGVAALLLLLRYGATDGTLQAMPNASMPSPARRRATLATWPAGQSLCAKALPPLPPIDGSSETAPRVMVVPSLASTTSGTQLKVS